jgi:dephospho-CoA kinase
MVAGVAGKYCAGKNAVISVLEERGFAVIDVDALGHHALVTACDQVVKAFGPRILGPDGQIDRRRLGSVVFGDSAKRERLESIVHPIMVSEVKRQVTDHAGDAVAINAAILFQMDLDRLCDFVLWVTAPLFLRVRRAMERDGLPVPQVLNRMAAQRRLKAQPGRESVDTYTVRNTADREFLRSQVLEILAAVDRGASET